MLKFLETRDEVVDLVHTVAEQPEMSSFKVGVAGSYVTSLNKKGSAIDIILKLKDGADKDLPGELNGYSGPYHDFNGITSQFGAHFILKIDKILMKKKCADAIINGVGKFE